MSVGVGTRTRVGTDATSPLLSLDHCLPPSSLAHDNNIGLVQVTFILRSVLAISCH
jgi:hypothetical protein